MEDNNNMTLPLEEADNNITESPVSSVEYTDDNIRHLDDMEHIRVRSGMYIGRLGDGSQNDDGIYVLLKEVMDNSIDEFKMGAGKRIEVTIEDSLRVSVRDYGRGIPQGKLVEAVSKLNTGGKYDSKAFKKSVGLNGVGIKAVNALSSRFEVRSYRDGKVRTAIFEKGTLLSDVTEDSTEESGTYIFFEPDATLFLNYSFQNQFVETLLRNYTYLNTGLTFIYNGQRIVSRHGLEDLLKDNMTSEGLYDIIHLKGEDIEIAFTHTNQYIQDFYQHELDRGLTANTVIRMPRCSSNLVQTYIPFSICSTIRMSAKMRVLKPKLEAATAQYNKPEDQMQKQQAMMALKGAEILIYPTAIGWESSDTDDEKARQLNAWIISQRGHAVANGLPVVSVNRVGHEPDPSMQTNGILFWGNSFVAGPQGEFLAQAGNERPENIVVEVDLERSENVRRWWPFLRDRRIDAYAGLTKRFLD